jgi:hypothetical protein
METLPATLETLKPVLMLDDMLQWRRDQGFVTEAVFTDRDGTWEVTEKVKDESGNEREILDPEVVAASQTIFDEGVATGRPTIIVTGRATIATETEILRDKKLPKFAAIVGAVGTEISYLSADGTHYVRDEDYRRLLLGKFDRMGVAAKGKELIGRFRDLLPGLELDFQKPEIEQAFLDGEEAETEEFKVSFGFKTYEAEALLPVIQAAFDEAYTGLHVVISGQPNRDPNNPNGPKEFFLDVIPATKRDAVDYIMKSRGIDVGYMQGDSGNDTDAIANSLPNVFGIAVGGSQPELITALEPLLVPEEEGGRVGIFQMLKRLDVPIDELEYEKLLRMGAKNEKGSKALVNVFRALGHTAVREAIFSHIGVPRPDAGYYKYPTPLYYDNVIDVFGTGAYQTIM